MLSIDVCRNLLGFVGTHLTDTEVFALRDQFMELAGSRSRYTRLV